MNKKYLSQHFALMEFVESSTARKHGIDNTPSSEAIENLYRLCIHTLEPLREELGLPVIITSGYRCRALNCLLAHHSSRSQHVQGCAADFHVGEAQGSSGLSRRELLIKAFRLIITSEKIDYDQVILYPTFIHVSYVSRDKNRRQITKANGQGTYCGLTREQALSILH